MKDKRNWIRSSARLLLIGLLVYAVTAPLTTDRAYADGYGTGNPITPPCDSCGIDSVQPDDTNLDQGLVSRLEIFLLTMPVTGI